MKKKSIKTKFNELKKELSLGALNFAVASGIEKLNTFRIAIHKNQVCYNKYQID